MPSNRVEKFNNWAVSDRCQGHGMSWVPHGVISLAALEAARQNREWAGWWPDRSLPAWKFPEPPEGAPDRAQAGAPVPERSGISQNSQELHNQPNSLPDNIFKIQTFNNNHEEGVNAFRPDVLRRV